MRAGVVSLALVFAWLGCGVGTKQTPSDAAGVAGHGGAGGEAGTGAGGGGAAGTGAPSAGTAGASAGTGGELAGTSGSSAGTAGTGGASAGTGGGLAGTGGSSAGTGGGGRGGASAGAAGSSAGTGGGALGGRGGAAGSLNPGAPEPRILIVDRATDRFVAYDRSGQAVHDYHAALDFGAGFTGRNAWVDWHVLPWDGSLDISPPHLGQPTRGLSVPVPGSRILLRAENAGMGQVKVKVLTVAGAVENAFTVAGTWGAFQLSPARRYVYAVAKTATDAQAAAVVRPSDGAILWQKTVDQAVFGGGNDSRLLYCPSDRSSTLRIKNLTTGDDVAPTLPSQAFGGDTNVDIILETGLDQRALFRAGGFVLQSRLLYATDWQGTITRFGADVPKYTDEYLQGFDPAGTRALWSRQTNGLDGKPSVYVGAYEMALTSTTATPWNGTDFACFGRTSEKAVSLSGTDLQSCNCGDGVCATIATLPDVEAGWSPRVVTNPDRRTVLVDYSWSLNRSPATRPDIRCFTASGTLLATLPYGAVDLDDTGQIVLLRATAGSNAGQFAVVDLARGEIHWLGAAPAAAVIVYE